MRRSGTTTDVNAAARLLAVAAALLLLFAAAGVSARDPIRTGAPVVPRPAPPEPRHGRSVGLYRMTSGFLPADGILSLGAAAELYKITYGADRDQVDFFDYAAEMEYGPLPWLRCRGRLPYRSWSGGDLDYPADGSGIGDADFSLTWKLPSPWSSLGVSLDTGTALPTGDEAGGLGEGIESPRLTLALTRRFWVDSDYPEVRLHLNAGRRWNRREAGRTAAGDGLLEPWPPIYPAAADAGDNDFLLLGAAVEVRRGITSLYAEYTEARLDGAQGIATREFQRNVTMGLLWGDDAGMALSAAVDVSLAVEDTGTPFEAAYPDLVYRLGFSRAFSIGGRDRDRDGIKDRVDLCPGAPEDRDGFEDEDGCPDYDNDQDGVPDDVDRAPTLPEDRDGFEDDDGIPDPDNDQDGIPDFADACPDLAEDMDGYQDDDGCPEEISDRDGDGIPDAEDDCPDEAEDRDGYRDGDGCPEPDNDLDGIADPLDDCPDLAEDYDGVDDGDGCPDPMPESEPEPEPEPAAADDGPQTATQPVTDLTGE